MLASKTIELCVGMVNGFCWLQIKKKPQSIFKTFTDAIVKQEVEEVLK